MTIILVPTNESQLHVYIYETSALANPGEFAVSSNQGILTERKGFVNMRVVLKTPQGMPKEAKVGFSWTTFFLGPFPALFRGDFKWAIIMTLAAFLTFGVSWLVFPFFYNKLYLKEVAEKGWVPADESSHQILKSRGIFFAEDYGHSTKA